MIDPGGGLGFTDDEAAVIDRAGAARGSAERSQIPESSSWETKARSSDSPTRMPELLTSTARLIAPESVPSSVNCPFE